MLRVLFVCTHNCVRSPMAAGLMLQRFGTSWDVQSCGMRPGLEIDPLARAVMAEIDIDLGPFAPQGFDDLLAGTFNSVVSLSAEAHHWTQEWADRLGTEASYWPTPDPTLSEGSREQRLEEYRYVRRQLETRIARSFSETGRMD